MERKDLLVVETFLGLILIVLVIFLIYLFGGLSASVNSVKVNSDNNISYGVSSKTYCIDYSVPDVSPKRYVPPKCELVKVPYTEYVNYSGKSLEFSSTGKHLINEGMFGNSVDNYIVYVKNKAYQGGYFTVKFSFSDYYGNKFTEAETKYIYAGEEAEFLYRSVGQEKYEFYSWNYQVISDSKVSSDELKPVTKYRLEKQCSYPL